MILCGAALFTGCSLVDEDLSDCGTDAQVDYQLRLVTNVTTELETQLGLAPTLQIQGRLKDYLVDIFTDYARDVDLSFYDIQPPMPRLTHMSEVMNGSESSYTLYLPAREYMHTAVANIRGNNCVDLADDEQCPTARLVQKSGEGVLPPHNTGIFTARKDMKVLSDRDQEFDVRLFMANAATALVLDLSEVTTVKDLSVTVSGFASEFRIADSTFVFSDKDAVIGTSRLETEDGMQCFVSVHFPSRPAPETKVVIDDGGGSPGVSPDPLWHWTVHATMMDGKVTESVIQMHNPLLAGHLKVLRATVQDTGIVTTANPEVGVSVTLDWHDAGNYPIDL